MVGNAATQWSSAMATFAYITSSTTVTSVADVSRGACGPRSPSFKIILWSPCHSICLVIPKVLDSEFWYEIQSSFSS